MFLIYSVFIWEHIFTVIFQGNRQTMMRLINIYIYFACLSVRYVSYILWFVYIKLQNGRTRSGPNVPREGLWMIKFPKFSLPTKFDFKKF